MTKDERIDRLEKAVRELSAGIRYQIQTDRESYGESIDRLMADLPDPPELSAFGKHMARQWHTVTEGSEDWRNSLVDWNATLDVVRKELDESISNSAPMIKGIISVRLAALKEPSNG